MMDKKSNIQYIQGPAGISIPPDPKNSRYQDFMAIDTEAHLCARVVIPEPVASTTPTQEERIAAMEDTILAMMGV